MVAVLMSLVYAEAASYTDENGLVYNLDSNHMTASVHSLPTSYAGAITIPATITNAEKEYTVTSIDNYAFNNCNKLTGVTL